MRASGERAARRREGEARGAAVDHEEVEGLARAGERTASERLGGGGGEARVATVDHEEVEGRARTCERAASERLGGGFFLWICADILWPPSASFVFFHLCRCLANFYRTLVFARAPSLENGQLAATRADDGFSGRHPAHNGREEAGASLGKNIHVCCLRCAHYCHRHYRFGTCAAINPRKHYPKRTQLRMSLTDALFAAFCIQAGFPGQPPS